MHPSFLLSCHLIVWGPYTLGQKKTSVKLNFLFALQEQWPGKHRWSYQARANQMRPNSKGR